MNKLKKLGDRLSRAELKRINGGSGPCLAEGNLCNLTGGGHQSCCEGLVCKGSPLAYFGTCQKVKKKPGVEEL